MKNDFNTSTSEELRVQNDVIRLSIDLLDLCHKGSVTVNRHDIFLKNRKHLMHILMANLHILSFLL